MNPPAPDEASCVLPHALALLALLILLGALGAGLGYTLNALGLFRPAAPET